MKRVLKTVALLLLFAALLSIFVGCSSGAAAGSHLVFDKEYKEVGSNDDSRCFVFHSDRTGYCEAHVSGTYYSIAESKEVSYTVSAKWEFRWAMADDGSVALFHTKTTYYDDTTEERSFLDFNSAMPLTVGDGFLIAHGSTQYGDYVARFVLEGSSLEQAVKGD